VGARQGLVVGSLLALCVASVAACSASHESPLPDVQAAPLECVPNRSAICLCPNGLDQGVQQCTKDGKLTACAPCGNSIGDPKTDAATACGDGQIDPGEACDDGNDVDGDGCSAACAPDGSPAAGATCPGQPVALWRSTSVALAGSTDAYTNHASARCASAAGPDRLYALKPMVDGTLTLEASFSSGFNAVLSVRDGTCGTTSAEVLCEDTLSKPVSRVLSVKKGRVYYLFVDGEATTTKGAFAVHLELL